MPYIKVNTSKIGGYATELDSTRITLNNIRASLKDLKYSLNWGARTRVETKLDQIENEMYTEATHLSKYRDFCVIAAQVYELGAESMNSGSQDFVKIIAKAVKTGADVTSFILDRSGDIGSLLKAGEVAKQITHKFKDGKMYLSGYTRASGLTSRYNFSTWINKGAIDATQFDVLDKIAIGLDVVSAGMSTIIKVSDVWADENKTVEKKICDTIANVGCAGAAVAVNVAGMVVGKAAGGAVAAACCAIPVVGPVVGMVAGAATSFVVGKAVSCVADALTSEAVVNQASRSLENVAGAVKAVANSQGVEKVVNTAKLVGTAVAEGAKVAVTATVEVVKNVGKAIGNFFKRW